MTGPYHYPPYTPPTELPPPPRWATYVPGRHPEFKIHTNLGHAKNAIHVNLVGVLYEWTGEKWTERFSQLERLRFSYGSQRREFEDRVKEQLKLIKA